MRGHILIGALLLCAVTTALHAAESECDRSESKTTPSPDGKWIASVQEEACATAAGASAAVTVVLSSAQDPAHSRHVFMMNVPRSRDDWPRVRWQGPNAIEVRVPNLAEVNPPEPGFDGIHVSLAYCGDNPADRQRLADYRVAVKQWQKDVTAWVQKRKQDPDAAGPRPERPEEPRLDPGRCTD